MAKSPDVAKLLEPATGYQRPSRTGDQTEPETGDRAEPVIGWNRQSDEAGNWTATESATGRSRQPNNDKTDDRAELTTRRSWTRTGLIGWATIEMDG